MGRMTMARFPHGTALLNPTLADYVKAADYLEADLHAAGADGLSLRVVRLRTDLNAYRRVIRMMRWRLQMSPRF